MTATPGQKAELAALLVELEQILAKLCALVPDASPGGPRRRPNLTLVYSAQEK